GDVPRMGRRFQRGSRSRRPASARGAGHHEAMDGYGTLGMTHIIATYRARRPAPAAPTSPTSIAAAAPGTRAGRPRPIVGTSKTRATVQAPIGTSVSAGVQRMPEPAAVEEV